MVRLKISISLFIILVLISMIGPFIAPYKKDFQENIRIKVVDNENVRMYSPHAPDTEHLFGTNQWGYDLLTVILYGIKYTLIIAVGGAFIRFLLGLIIGLPLSFKENIKGFSLKGLNSIPIFILAYFFLFRITTQSALPFIVLFLIQVSVIGLLGLPSTISSIKNYSVLILKEGFIEAAYSCGAGNLRILLKHVIPLIFEKLMILFVSEMIGVLNIVGQLGIFNLFIGGTKLSTSPALYHSVTNELAGLIGQGRLHVYYDKWLLFFPLITYLVILFIVHFLQSSMENYLRVKSRVITYI